MNDLLGNVKVHGRLDSDPLHPRAAPSLPSSIWLRLSAVPLAGHQLFVLRIDQWIQHVVREAVALLAPQSPYMFALGAHCCGSALVS